MIKLNSSVHKTAKMLYVILLESTADAFLTYAGIRAGRIEEVNPLLKTAVYNPYMLFSIKILLPLMAVFIVLKAAKRGSTHLSKFTVLLISFH